MYYFYRNNYGAEIIRKSPLINKSINLSRLIAIIYFALAIILMFVSPIISKYIHEIYCIAK